MKTQIARTVFAALVTICWAGIISAQDPSAGVPGVSPARIPTEPELVGTLPYSTTSAPIQYIMIQVGDGGSGPHKSVLVGDPALKTHTLYRPRDLQPFGPGLKLPVVAYGNGGCRNASHEVRNLLTEIASHGFLVIAIGPALGSAFGGALVSGPTKSSQLLDAIDWAAAENSREGSAYFGKVDTTKVAVMGQSCGGLQAIEVSSDPRITTTVLLNSGVLNAPIGGPGRPGAGLSGMPNVTKDRLATLHAPIAYIIGGKIDIAYPNASDDFSRIEKVPVLMANREVGHYPATYLEPRGGAFGQAASAWLKWQLKGDQTAAKIFIGATCGLCADPKWSVKTKNM